jgi:arginyl-tRNA synthetase
MTNELAQLGLLFEGPAIRLSDARIAELAPHRRRAPAARELLANAPCIVDCCDPNPTTALHAGYLRSIALGHALASMLE